MSEEMKEETVMSPMPATNDVKIMRYKFNLIEESKGNKSFQNDQSRSDYELVERQQSIESCEIDEDENISDFAGGRMKPSTFNIDVRNEGSKMEFYRQFPFKSSTPISKNSKSLEQNWMK
jgi:hypothetical protein